MEIVLVAQGLPFGPTTIGHRSLGGSETAALMMVRELRKLGHLVTIFCNLPPQGYPDFIENGAQDDLGVRWVSFEQYEAFIANTDVDLLVVSRNPDLFNCAHQAKKAVLWCHDLATYQGFLPRLMSASWNFDEIWTVSEFHKKQIHDITSYPEKNIKATRNGIVKFDCLLDIPREEKVLLYSARPERGLELLVKPGGIMERLPDFKLKVTMYENYPEQMMGYYRMLWERCHALPNVELLGAKTQLELRQLMVTSWAYIYPTYFEEVSCIIARECIEQKLPFITTTVGALPETLGDCGIFYECEKADVGSEEFCEKFASMVETVHASYVEGSQDVGWYRCAAAMAERTDLYWDEVAAQWEDWAGVDEPRAYSRILSMIKDADIIPAIAYAETVPLTDGIIHLKAQLRQFYGFLFGDITIEEHYKKIYDFETSKGVVERNEMRTLKGHNRYNGIADEVRKLPAGSTVLDYGCAEGPIILGLAQDFPEINFIGVDFVKDNIVLCNKFALEADIGNTLFLEGSSNNWPEPLMGIQADLVIVSEVLEHVERPWEMTDFLEGKVKIGGRLVLTVPQGQWEWGGLKSDQWPWRAHIWHINKWMLRKMYDKKEGCVLSNLTEGLARDGRSAGHLIMAFTVDKVPAMPIDPIEKAMQHRTRQSLAVCMIAMDDEDQIIKCLNSIKDDVDLVKIAMGPSTDHTQEYVNTWMEAHPWIEYRIISVPKIEAGKYGFDDARNASMGGIESDWILWIDSDEYLSGHGILMFLRDNCFDSYAIHQHHFTCEPRGEPAQLDKPARLMRNDGRFQFFGKVHEHAELGYNGGPGFVMILPNIDIAHTGYVNDFIRRGRFGRNYPLLEWDREVYPDRRLGRYLWLRDMIHRVRMIDASGDKLEARRLAEEAVEFYAENAKDFEGVGSGNVAGNNALQYYSEALQYLGRGHQVAVQVQFDGQTAAYIGTFETAEEVFELGTRAVAEEMKKRKSGYWV